MSWIRMNMRFPGTCIVCKGKIQANEMGLWAKGVGVKHEKCAQTDSINCMVCGRPAGCSECEFADECDLQNVSQLCVCDRCIAQGDVRNNLFELYRNASIKKFPTLG